MSTLKVGLSRVDITPPVGTELCGFGPYLERRSQSVLHRLAARACVFQLGRTRLALVGLDLVSVTRAITAAVRRGVRRATGIPEKNVMLCCTHTHSGPNTAGYIAWGQPNPAYLKRLPGRIVRAVRKADRALRPSTLSLGEGRIRGISVNRVGAPKNVDHRLAVLRIESAGRLAGFIAHCSVHPVVLGQASRVISGDFVGLGVELAAEPHPGCLGLFAQGACGDINAADTNCGPPQSLPAVRRHAEALAASIRRALQQARPLAVPRLKAIRRSITLPQVPTTRAEVLMMFNEGARMADCRDCPERIRRQGRFIRDAYATIFKKLKRGDRPGRRTEIQGFALGDLLLLAQPSELYNGFYTAFRRRLRGKRLILAGYANDAVGYIPEPAGYRVDRLPLPGYQYYAPYVVPVIMGDYRFREDAGAVLLDKLAGLARGLST